MAGSNFFSALFRLIFGARSAPAPRQSPPPPPPPVAAPPPAPPPVAPPPAPPPVAPPPVAPPPVAPPPAPPPVAPPPFTPAPTPPAPPPITGDAPPPLDSAPEPAPPIDIAPPDPPPPDLPPNQLSPHFSLHEFTHSNTAVARGIDNTPPPEILERMKATAAQMERVRELLGGKPIKINSAFRNPATNAAVGGSPTSDHMSGYSVDFTCAGFGTPFDVATKIRQSPIFDDVDQLIHEFGRWVHVSFDPDRRHDDKTAHYVMEGGTRRTRYTPGIHPLNSDGSMLG